MSKIVLALLLALPASATFAQATSDSDSRERTRAEVKADYRSSGPLSTKQTEYTNPPSTKGSGTARAEVKAAERASGALGTRQIEYSDPPKPRKGNVATTRGERADDPFVQSRHEKSAAKMQYRQEQAKDRSEYKDAKKASHANLRASNQRPEFQNNLEVPTK